MSARNAVTPGPLKVDLYSGEIPFRVFSEATQGNVGLFYAESDAQRFAAHEELVRALLRAERWITAEMLEKGWPEERVSNPPEGSHLHAIRIALASAGAA